VATADYIVAVVNSEPITNHEVRRELRRVQQQFAQQGRPAPAVSELTAQVLERLISDKAQLQLARDVGINVDDVAVDQAELSVAEQNQLDLAGLHARLAADGSSASQFRSQLREQLTLTRLREREVEARVRVSDTDIEQYLSEQLAGTDLSKQLLNVAQILIAVADDASPAQVSALQVRAEAALARARAGEDFAALAKELSNSADRANGGLLGLRSADRYPPLFVQATQGLAVGGLSGVIRSGAGFHVLKLMERQAAGLPPMTVTQTRARHILLRPTAQLSETAAKEQLAALKRRIESGQADFAATARTLSQDGSAAQGGDLGWASPGQFVPEFENVMNQLRPGQISEPVVSRFGVHLMQLMERRQVKLSEREQREAIRNVLREKKMDEAYLNWAQDVRARAYVEMREPPQ
jgi:peptidyl-prolyl cis-trans isomerase SurA